MSHIKNIKGRWHCLHCKYTTRIKHDALKHLDIHLGIKRYKCDLCNRRFRQSSHLKCHYRSIHDVYLKLPRRVYLTANRFERNYRYRNHASNNIQMGTRREEIKIFPTTIINSVQIIKDRVDSLTPDLKEQPNSELDGNDEIEICETPSPRDCEETIDPLRFIKNDVNFYQEVKESHTVGDSLIEDPNDDNLGSLVLDQNDFISFYLDRRNLVAIKDYISNHTLKEIGIV